MRNMSGTWKYICQLSFLSMNSDHYHLPFYHLHLVFYLRNCDFGEALIVLWLSEESVAVTVTMWLIIMIIMDFDRYFSQDTHLSTFCYTKARRLSHTDKIKANRMQTSPSCSALSKIPADSTNLKRKAAEVLATISVSQRNRTTIAGQDWQPITPGQWVHENESQSHSPQKTCYD